MKYFYSLSAALLTPTIALIQPYITFAALSAADIDQIATAITVKIVDVANPGDSGSGVIIKQTGNTYTVLTAFHVVQDGAKNLITPDEKIYRLKNVKPLPDKVDLAIAEFSSNQKYTVAKIGNSDAAVRTTTVYVAGFPSPSGGIKNPDLFINTGTVNANGRAQSEGYNIFYSNDTLRGMSGGAVLNDKGELVAIHGRVRAEEVEEKSQSKAIFGYGITIYSALRQMAKVGIDVGVKPPDVVATALKPDDFLIKGNEKYDQKDWRGALADYNQAIKLDSNYATAYMNRGVVRSELGDKQGAIADYNQAIKINPNDADTYYNRGIVRNELGDKQGALADYNQAIKINPNYAQAYNNRGVVRSELGDKQGAITDYTQAIKINPKYADAYYNRGNVRSELEDKQGAIADYTQAIKINPKYAEAYGNRGNVRSELEDKQGALTDYNQAIKINPKDADAYYNRGNVRDDLGDKQGAIADYNQAIKINPNYANAYYNRGIVRDDLGDKQGAITDYNQAIKINPNYANAYYNRGIVRNELGDKQGAIQDVQKAGELYKQQGDNAKYERAMKLLELIKNQR